MERFCYLQSQSISGLSPFLSIFPTILNCAKMILLGLLHHLWVSSGCFIKWTSKLPYQLIFFLYNRNFSWRKKGSVSVFSCFSVSKMSRLIFLEKVVGFWFSFSETCLLPVIKLDNKQLKINYSKWFKKNDFLLLNIHWTLCLKLKYWKNNSLESTETVFIVDPDYIQ